jgi:hypothetical protein
MEDFKHFQSAHCENGVTVNLFKHAGLDFMTEPLAFGLGSGLFYIHIPFMKINNGPAISFRTMPGAIFARTAKGLGVKVERIKFKSEEKGEAFLDELIAQNKLVGSQVGVFHLPYFPKEYRFHFNAHNILIYGKEGDRYLVSDPVMETVTSLTKDELTKVRFAKGALAPKGQLYYPKFVPKVEEIDLKKAIKKAIKRNVRDMLKAPGNIIGVSGIKGTGRKIEKWRDKLGERQAALYLGQIVRMQEEIGTGGGGFRFIYAAFLEEAAQLIKNDELLAISEKFTHAGDLWRESAVQMAGIYKGRLNTQADYKKSAEILYKISDVEKDAFKQLDKIKF